MYRCTLNITIFSTDEVLTTVAPKISPQVRFTHVFNVYSTFSKDALRGSDIVILNLPTPYSLRELRHLCKSTTIFILCVAADRIGSLSDEDFSVLDDVWILPCSTEYITFKFETYMEKMKMRKDLYLYQNYLETVMNTSPNMVWVKDLRGAHVLVNDAFAAAVGKTKNDIVGRGHYYIWDIPPDEYAQGEYVCLETEEIVLREQRPCVFDEMVKTRTAMRQLKTFKSPIFDEDGLCIGTVGIAHDVTDLENMDNELEVILRSMPYAILVKNTQDEVVKANEKFAEFFHTDDGSILGANFSAWKSATFTDERCLASGEATEADYTFNGETRIMQMQEKPIYDVFEELVGHIFICHDVTIERNFEQQILKHANTDALTGLANRRHFYESIDAQRRDRQLSLLYVDLDNFKYVNDTYGHHIGDMVLQTVSAVIRELFPRDIAARVGGDEFLIALVGPCTEDFLAGKAQKLLEKLDNSFHISESLRPLSASIGIAMSTDSGLHIDELIKQSDTALYVSKNRGKAQYSVYKPQ